ncbi:MAG TPA: AraC family transcriptional regulator [Gaiellaceae bacterium]
MAATLEVQRPSASPEPGHRPVVERVIEAMNERLDERFSLARLAALAYYSPFHFHRLFRHVTGVPPGRFFGALRIEAAKRLLLTSDLSVTQICVAVGYHSLGTFTSQFTRLVGISPRGLRALARANGSERLSTLLAAPFVDPAAKPVIAGRVEQLDASEGTLAAIGLFPSRLAEGTPAGCTLAPVPGDYELAASESGSFHVLALSIDACASLNDLLLDDGGVHVAATAAPLVVQPGRPVRADLTLRPRTVTDPPILLALSLLVGSAGAEDRGRRRAAR